MKLWHETVLICCSTAVPDEAICFACFSNVRLGNHLRGLDIVRFCGCLKDFVSRSYWKKSPKLLLDTVSVRPNKWTKRICTVGIAQVQHEQNRQEGTKIRVTFTLLVDPFVVHCSDDYFFWIWSKQGSETTKLHSSTAFQLVCFHDNMRYRLSIIRGLQGPAIFGEMEKRLVSIWPLPNSTFAFTQERVVSASQAQEHTVLRFSRVMVRT